jgi:hypothetical protein
VVEVDEANVVSAPISARLHVLLDGWTNCGLRRKPVSRRERIPNAQEPLVDRIVDLHAIAPEGQAARARSYALWDAELMKPQDDIEGLCTQAIVRNLVAGSAGGMNRRRLLTIAAAWPDAAGRGFAAAGGPLSPR